MWTGDRVRQLRREADLAQADLAALLSKLGRCSCDAGTVSRWERGGPIRPSYRRLLTEAARMLGGQEAGTERRTFLQLMAAGMTGFGLVDFERLVAPGADAAWLRDAESVSIAIARQRNLVSPDTLIPAASGHLGALEARLPASSYLAGQTALLTASLFIKGGQLAQAYRCYSTAEGLGDNVVRAKAISGRAAVHNRMGDGHRALALQDQAVATIAGASPGAEAGVLARRAELRAQAGRDADAMRDLEAAGNRLGKDEHRWYFLDPTNDVDLGAIRGASELLLGRHREAASTLEWVLERMPPEKALWRARVAADREVALAALC